MGQVIHIDSQAGNSGATIIPGSDPPLVTNVLWFNTNVGELFYWDGASWIGSLENLEGFSNASTHVNGEFFAYGLIYTSVSRGPAYSNDYNFESATLVNGSGAGVTGDIKFYGDGILLHTETFDLTSSNIIGFPSFVFPKDTFLSIQLDNLNVDFVATELIIEVRKVHIP